MTDDPPSLFAHPASMHNAQALSGSLRAPSASTPTPQAADHPRSRHAPDPASVGADKARVVRAHPPRIYKHGVARCKSLPLWPFGLDQV